MCTIYYLNLRQVTRVSMWQFILVCCYMYDFFFYQELNVRQLTLSTDKDKYGIRLRAEPDHMVLGKRLKGAFKSVTASIKELKSEELEAFQRTGMYHL